MDTICTIFFIPLGLLVIKSNSCQQTSMIWGNTGYEIVEIDLSFLKTKQDKLHQIHQNLNIYFFKLKNLSFKSSHIFMCKMVPMKFLLHYIKRCQCFRGILMQPHHIAIRTFSLYTYLMFSCCIQWFMLKKIFDIITLKNEDYLYEIKHYNTCFSYNPLLLQVLINVKR